MDDREIIELYYARSEKAIEETRKKYGRLCRYIAFKILLSHEDAEEIENDTYIKAWSTIPPASPDPLKGYLAIIANRLAINRYNERGASKRGGNIPAILEELSDTVCENDGNIIDDVALKDSINRFLSSLSKKTRIIFVKRYWYALSVTDIAEEMNMRVGSVTSVLCRTRKRLRVFLQKEGHEL